jgi:DNA-directed RNA polymerase specialized sigma24 family protein
LAERKRLINELKPDERTALLLLGLGYSYEEIGSGRGWSYTKVNRCIAEGRAELRTRLRDDPADGGGTDAAEALP